MVHEPKLLDESFRFLLYLVYKPDEKTKIVT